MSSPEFDTLKTEVGETRTVMASATLALQGLSARLKDAIAALPDPAELNQLSADLDAETNALAQAIVDNP